MPRYLFQGSYSQEGAQGLLREGGTRRRAAVERLVAAASADVSKAFTTRSETPIFS